MSLTAADLLALTDAVRALERPSVGARIANVVGSPIERLIGMLPARASGVIAAAARKAIHGALKLSLRTLATHDTSPGGKLRRKRPTAGTSWPARPAARWAARSGWRR